MKTVSRIDPIPRKQKKLRVAAYCRVSTDMDAQLESLEAQKSYYENYIGSRADWPSITMKVSPAPRKTNDPICSA